MAKKPAPGRPKPASRRPGLDDLDRRLLARLQDDGRASSAELAREFHLSPPGLQKRLRRLEDMGAILRYTAIVNREAVGLDLLCYVLVMLAHHRPDSVGRFRDGIESMAQVLECHDLTGEFDCLIKAVVADHEELQRFLERLMKLGGIDRLRTAIVLKEIKTSTRLPI